MDGTKRKILTCGDRVDLSDRVPMGIDFCYPLDPTGGFRRPLNIECDGTITRQPESLPRRLLRLGVKTVLWGFVLYCVWKMIKGTRLYKYIKQIIARVRKAFASLFL